ncbi:hypothetical protein RFI_23726 [Reticulomyxa filosa]|uniref:Uncharacterized protein n=1 Tax=Reticulomyxa filosa TaxID=46433 RepID=X6MJM0_RETFI|nr:hypothetical protein RFI_23726 [Reticulomyxa filosa]|eukprot:ETO13642.1 hypothetical protein RFI_23726 [Reticulomyxa filosa]
MNQQISAETRRRVASSQASAGFFGNDSGLHVLSEDVGPTSPRHETIKRRANPLKIMTGITILCALVGVVLLFLQYAYDDKDPSSTLMSWPTIFINLLLACYLLFQALFLFAERASLFYIQTTWNFLACAMSTQEYLYLCATFHLCTSIILFVPGIRIVGKFLALFILTFSIPIYGVDLIYDSKKRHELRIPLPGLLIRLICQFVFICMAYFANDVTFSQLITSIIDG